MTTQHRTGGEILVAQLIRQGVEHVFCVPGESYLAVLDALHDTTIALTVCRQEAGAAMMADAVARLSGRPGIAMVTRGPGATNAAHAIHVAQHDSVPLILFVGQIERSMRGRGAFQELDYPAVFGAMAKWVVEIDEAARIPELVSRAFHVALQGRPGPVVIALPEDMLTEAAAVADAPTVEPVPTWPGLTQMAELQKLLWKAERPVLVLGGTGWTDKARAGVARFAERFALPVATSFRRADLIDADHPGAAGEIGLGPNPALKALIEAADLVILLGARMAEVPSQAYTLMGIPAGPQAIVHIHPDPGELGRVYHPTLGILASPAAFAASLESLQPPQVLPWAEATAAAHSAYQGWSEAAPRPAPGPVDMAAVLAWLRDHLPDDAVVTNGAGNYAIWVGRFMRFTGARRQLAPTSGSMGYGVPAAIGAQRLAPDRTVVAFAGDGCFLMNGQEFATAVQYGLPVVFIVVDNGMYGTIRMHQERAYPARVSGTALRNPDFAAYARAFGGHGETVARTADFAGAFERCLASGQPAIIHMEVDPEALTPGRTLSEVRQDGEAARQA
ncbi:thiamine pyrophosphate-binding protein [Lichenihabitans sp. Uapishka_5]|uniref:thiamine pyrophosphate-binding protein n=1 Tax=Lichenihabitans sp. Uapishka_5 TaxID=3037302 RepID=UPI0029E80025|nr:thiamine pyrophosphate-binding protein [Lichenihabitans sp. Uapishka_5]MDX7952076.1 thiamine pyrophosphate-binding protein [Lichenihabitans sp. Uapishka_5]